MTTTFEPLSGLGPGFNNPQAGYVWQMCEHDGWFYAGTTVRTPFVWFADWDRMPEGFPRPEPEVLDEYVWDYGGADIYWRPVARALAIRRRLARIEPRRPPWRRSASTRSSNR